MCTARSAGGEGLRDTPATLVTPRCCHVGPIFENIMTDERALCITWDVPQWCPSSGPCISNINRDFVVVGLPLSVPLVRPVTT